MPNELIKTGEVIYYHDYKRVNSSADLIWNVDLVSAHTDHVDHGLLANVKAGHF